jgi:PIN domain nuclease of toxin-antitoxin system
MVAGVADTHAAVWYLFNDARLSITAGDFIEGAAKQARRIIVSAITLVEVVYLIEKHRLPRNAYEDLTTAFANPSHVLKELAFTSEIVDSMWRVSRADVPDMPDRVVAATALYLGVPVISRDGKIRASNVQTIW